MVKRTEEQKKEPKRNGGKGTRREKWGQMNRERHKDRGREKRKLQEQRGK